MFRFRLEKVLRYRRRLVDEQAGALKEAREILDRIRDERNRLEQEIARLVAEGDRVRRRTHDASLWRRQADFICSQEERLGLLGAREDEAARQVEEEREKLLEAHRDQQVLEKLEETQRAEWQREQGRLERKDLDEIGAIRAHGARQQ